MTWHFGINEKLSFYSFYTESAQLQSAKNFTIANTMTLFTLDESFIGCWAESSSRKVELNPFYTTASEIWQWTLGRFLRFKTWTLQTYQVHRSFSLWAIMKIYPTILALIYSSADVLCMQVHILCTVQATGKVYDCSKLASKDIDLVQNLCLICHLLVMTPRDKLWGLIRETDYLNLAWWYNCLIWTHYYEPIYNLKFRFCLHLFYFKLNFFANPGDAIP